ncbi:uncharacterized protein LOC104651814 isoform X2 [Saimiri boliviensis]|uniref:uncharacterized protein LOC104651814 isoform X2 n=1 Tax=Saimiri boliviensis TaxID=27679 RepID=UPI003D782D6B
MSTLYAGLIHGAKDLKCEVRPEYLTSWECSPADLILILPSIYSRWSSLVQMPLTVMSSREAMEEVTNLVTSNCVALKQVFWILQFSASLGPGTCLSPERA